MLSLFNGLLEGSLGRCLVGMLLHEVLELLESVFSREAACDALDDAGKSEGSHAVVLHDRIPMTPNAGSGN